MIVNLTTIAPGEYLYNPQKKPPSWSPAYLRPLYIDRLGSWLLVRRRELEDIGIATKVSSGSRQRGEMWVYLCDKDQKTFFKAWEKQNGKWMEKINKRKVTADKGYSDIRGWEKYCYYNPAELKERRKLALKLQPYHTARRINLTGLEKIRWLWMETQNRWPEAR